MPEPTLTRDERLALRARAHHLNPVVLLGSAGLTEAVLKETDRALIAHELIKVRVPGADRDERESIAVQMAEQLGAARVQTIGKLLVLYRPRPPEEPEQPPQQSSKAAPAQRSGRPSAVGPTRGAPTRAGKPLRRAAPARSGGRGR